MGRSVRNVVGPWCLAAIPDSMKALLGISRADCLTSKAARHQGDLAQPVRPVDTTAAGTCVSCQFHLTVEAREGMAFPGARELLEPLA